ncbi:hypothetical protein [Hyphobacterium sp.]|uniref:hypothetical protein n=1 Tax=Hyphobacterium sp. TaxID=2004662 RepID=UPI0037491800
MVKLEVVSALAAAILIVSPQAMAKNETIERHGKTGTAIAANSLQSDPESAALLMRIGMGSLIQGGDPGTSEGMIVDALADGADPLSGFDWAPGVYGEYQDHFAYLIHMAEILSEREAAATPSGPVPANWRERARNYYVLMAEASDAPPQAFNYLELALTPAGETTAHNPEGVADTFARLMTEATAPDEEISSVWETYQRDVYGEDAVIDW